ncbi:reverse transcriptase domain-containing protein [Tanacetum coccineum]
MLSQITVTDRTEDNAHPVNVSKTLNDAEKNYSPLEKLALSLVNMTRRLKVIFEAQTCPSLDTLYGLGAALRVNSHESLVLIGPSGLEYTYALRLTFVSTNNEAEYEALLAGLRIARKMKVSSIEVKVDSKLVANHINGTYEATKESMIKYLAKAKEFISEFKTFSIENIPRKDNQKADILSKLATVPFSHLTKEILVEVLNERSTDAKEVQTIVEEEGENWTTPIINYLEEGIVPSDKNEARSLRSKINQYVLESGAQEQRAGKQCGGARGTKKAAAICEAKYKTKMEQYYNKRVRPAGFRPEEFVYRKNEASRMEDEGKFGPNWEGPYRVTEAFENGSYKLQTMDDNVVPRTWHVVNLRECYL